MILVGDCRELLRTLPDASVHLSRRWIGCELNPEYADIARRRLAGVTPGLPLAVSA